MLSDCEILPKFTKICKFEDKLNKIFVYEEYKLFMNEIQISGVE